MSASAPPVWLFRVGHWFQSRPAGRATIGLAAAAMTTAGALAALLDRVFEPAWSFEGAALAALACGLVAAPLGWMTHRLLRDLTATRSELLAMTTHDATTQAMNPRYFMRRAQQTIDRAGAGIKDLCVVLIRVDHFEALAARHGRAFVDEVLRAISGACLRQLRAHDLFARHGDDEFVGLLEASHPNLADIAMARLRRAVDVLQHVDANGVTVPVQVSFGMTRVDYDARSLEQALARIGHRGETRRAGDAAQGGGMGSASNAGGDAGGLGDGTTAGTTAGMTGGTTGATAVGATAGIDATRADAPDASLGSISSHKAPA